MKGACLSAAFFVCAAQLFAQTLPENGFSLSPEAEFPVFFASADSVTLTTLAGENETIMTGAPQWAKDLRRAEIVFFGSAPFTFFFARFVFDIARSGYHNWDTRYAPWPVRSGDSVSLKKKDVVIIISAAFSTSLVLAITDYLIVRNERKKQSTQIYGSE
ncbi:MAG: hypothetical protein LBJ31_09765 [Treponema sp.]|nr:hypothetical protein [Treponema sp.]